MTAKKTKQVPSFPIQVNVLPSRGLPISIDADEQERAWLAREAGAESVKRFRAELTASRWQRDGVRLAGTLRAALTQSCIVTLEPVESRIEELIDRTFVPPTSKLAKPRLNSDGEWLLDAEGADPPDVLESDTLDIWEILLEQFLLSVEPFPRAAGAVFEQAEPAEGEEDERPSPFAVLGKLRQSD